MLQTTSLLAFKEIRGKLGNRQDEVFVLLFRVGYPMANYEIAKALNRPINSITPRTGELVKMGYVEYKEDKYINGRKSIGWGVVAEPKERQEVMF